MAAAAACGALAAPAAGQEEERETPAAGDQPAVLLLVDASKSMAKDSGDGRSRMDVTKEAVRKLVDGLPSSAQLGVRAYGSRVSESTRRAGCRDTRQLVPVGPLDGDALTEAVDALEPTGRTPIGRSLRLAPDDFPAGATKRTVVLLSDGGDNCAPPDPCKVASQVARQGVELSIQVVGLQVADSARRQLRCIAEAGGGSYVDAGDADELLEELRAALARAFRSYEPTGKPVSGVVDPASAPTITPGEYLDTVRPGETRHYAVEVPKGRRLWFSATLVGEPGSNRGIAKTPFRLRFLNPAGEATREQFELYGTRDRKIETIADWGGVVGSEGFWARPGRYVAAVTLDASGNIDAADYPLELAARVLDGADPPGDRFTSRPQASARPSASAADDRDGDGSDGGDGTGPSDAALAGIGVGAVLIGLAGGALLGRRRAA